MKLDPRKLRPAELARLLNSTPLGEVARPHVVYRHRDLAGYRIGDGRRIDLVRYVAWLAVARHIRRPEAPGGAGASYEAMKVAAAERNRRLSVEGRDIGPIPEVREPQRKARACAGFRFFCETYFPGTFYLPWSPDHLKAMARIEDAVLRGGLYAYAMPRGSGKTVLVEAACIWAVLIGARQFVALIGSDEAHAVEMLDDIKVELECSERLLEDFPEVVHPIQRLEGITNRAAGQTYGGPDDPRKTYIRWTAKHIVLPTVEGSKAYGAVIRAAGLTGRIRGMTQRRRDGRTVRPSLVVLDDPQTDESARSPSQCANRERTLAGAVLGLAGPGVKMAGFMPCTVICPGDMADRILDRDKHPQWQGERTKMVYSFPSDTKLWDEYARIRAESLRNNRGGVEATGFYRKHRVKMDAGAKVAWQARYNPNELSAIQHAMNLKLQDEAAFFAEYQNEPLAAKDEDKELLTADQIAGKTNGHRRSQVPIECTRLTAFIDVHEKLLYWMVCAWADDFTGCVVDYGSHPGQKRGYFTLRDAKVSLAMVHRGAGLEGQIYAGMEAVAELLIGREWRRDDGAAMRIERCLIDASWGQSTDTVYLFCRQSRHAAVLLPCHGRYIGASSREFHEWTRRPGDQAGHHWMIPGMRARRAVRHVLADTNYWKSFVYTRLAVAMGDRGCLSLFGRQAASHRLLADHITAEYRVKTTGRGRTLDEWTARPGRPDNHWLDCLVGCAVAASICGVALPGMQLPQRRRKRYTQADMDRGRRESLAGW